MLLCSERACYSAQVSSKLSRDIDRGGAVGYCCPDDLRIDEPGVYKSDSPRARCDRAKSPPLAFEFAFQVAQVWSPQQFALQDDS